MTSDVLISIDRSGMAGASGPLEIATARGDATWLIVGEVQIPGLIPRRTYMPDNPDVHGSELIGFAYQQGIISFDCRPEVSDETALQVAVAELKAALGQFSFDTTITIKAGRPEVWASDVGAIEPSDNREYHNVQDSDPLYSVTIPVYPVAS